MISIMDDNQISKAISTLGNINITLYTKEDYYVIKTIIYEVDCNFEGNSKAFKINDENIMVCFKKTIEFILETYHEHLAKKIFKED